MIRSQRVCDQIDDCAVPVIAAINGVAKGSGLELALACHIRIASSNAQFDLRETKPGLNGLIQRLTIELGQERAQEMMKRETISVEEALDAGLINRITEPGALLSQSEMLATEIAKFAPLAIRACLQAVTRGLKLPLAEGLTLEAELFARLFSSEDMREGTRAFLEKRTPLFKGS
jgi:enoyl-CoA hydratase/carnithine racemase